MYNYHTNIVWVINCVLLSMLIITSIAIVVSVIVNDYVWQRRRRRLIAIKNDVFEILLAGRKPSDAVCQPFASSITPQQFIDIATNRNIKAAFFNDSEQQFFKNCFINPEQIARLEKIARTSNSKWRRIEAILSLGYTQTDHAIGIIKDSILSKDKDMAYFSVISLGQIKTVESARILLNFLKKNPAESYKVVAILENFPKEISDDIINLIDYHDPVVRFWAAKLLSKFAPAHHIKKLEKLTMDHAEDVRAAACDCLGNIGSKEAKPTLIKRLKDDSWLVRSHAIIAVGKVLGDEAVPQVIGFINDASWLVVEAVKGVMTDHIEASLPYIEQLLQGKDEIPKKYSVMALQDSGYLSKLLYDAVSGNNKDMAIRLLKGIVRSKVHTGLDAAVGSLDPARRAKAIELLVSIGEV